MTRSSIVAALVVALLLGILIWWRGEHGPKGHGPAERGAEALSARPANDDRAPGAVKAVPTARPVSPSSPGLAPAATQRPYDPPPLTEAMRERRRRVLDAPHARALATPAPPSPAREAPGGMKDRTGKLGPEVKAINEQLIPLVDQCFDQAKERGVRGRGMLALSVKLAGAEGIGRIIEAVEPALGNAIGDPELIDCVRQSAFTVDLPAPSSSGASDFMMTIPFEGAPDAGAPGPR